MRIRGIHPVTALLAFFTIPCVAQAAEVRLIPGQQDLPFYTRGSGHTDDGSLAAAVMLRSPDCIPKDADMIYPDVDLMDSKLSRKCPLLVEGFSIWEEGAIQPIHIQIWNPEGTTIPVWFISGPDLIEGWRDGRLTFKDYIAAPSLYTGTADCYFEVTVMNGQSEVRTTIATGWLDDNPDTTFTVHAVHYDNMLTGEKQYKVDITFNEK